MTNSAESKPAYPDGQGARTDPAFWDAQWDERDGRALSYRLLHSRDFGPAGAFLRVLDRHVGLKHFRDAKVVELGGAASNFLVDLALYTQSQVTAVDYSETGVRQTELLFRARGVEGEAVMADMFDWRDGEGKFDVVVHWGLLEHFDRPESVLDVTASVLKPGGLAIFTMPNLEAFGARIWQHVAPENYSKHIFHSDADVDRACASVGLTLTKTFHSGLPLMRMAPPENRGLVSVCADIGHAAVCLLSTMQPRVFSGGVRSVSNTRGFVAIKHRP